MSNSQSLTDERREEEEREKDSDDWSALGDEEEDELEAFSEEDQNFLTARMPNGLGYSPAFLDILRTRLATNNFSSLLILATNSNIQKLLRTLKPGLYKEYRGNIRKLLDLGEIVKRSPKKNFNLRNAKDWIPTLQIEHSISKSTYDIVEVEEIKKYRQFVRGTIDDDKSRVTPHSTGTRDDESIQSRTSSQRETGYASSVGRQVRQSRKYQSDSRYAFTPTPERITSLNLVQPLQHTPAQPNAKP